MIRIGTSGWSYDHWNGVLYPRGTPAKSRLAHYVDEFDTVELNGSFYRWPADTTFAGWRDQMPEGFTMSVKAHRGLTHYRRLRSPESWTPRFAEYWKLLGSHNEALLVQLHPALERDDDLLAGFLAQLPRRIQVAMELRHPSWDEPAVYELLEKQGAAYVVMSGPGLICRPVVTSDLAYVRMHGPPTTGSTPAATPTSNCRSGRSRSNSGTATATGSSCTSTTISVVMRSATPED
ncbi:hypothetical protein MFORT_04538 [Mycolicibacterium fortuitum subsp. fortuitum DSM 46621 = ATCC 6841 = JCM 6387]|uniref:DUF72 domain-containing protein n=1 Tax=Mycolicibacterium fortuitum subsp. fortuitum DSM 46621 = ATCC 6841 = JCM 6387 TaxID=1214102 RepID=K0V8P2_MYCFO|nr:hypothetical protein G155_16385 [Mycobacterium sp. VKM Ac-1817D]AMD55022.1 hypothetical protein ATO49_15730 [Mycolicibacterium fortuitum subsp. fortuitum DSM 46621 = ATCC 6841 = JCM 6387]EJZ15477.1 hypothetical protein MFORT_04538 [Mycolicibacterium fortuitum subsp. fortuitum DSM 46621 = ATCC 6841 = JCM 6387]BDD99221.1 hypothetical protein MFTT_33150 [Mycolicibacterium fortuitum subsp. fortuitum]CRL57140.1 hypothetical protein CPGR_04469 [Mycolicibacterium fortuitum subsp. fortuitum DSM 4662